MMLRVLLATLWLVTCQLCRAEMPCGVEHVVETTAPVYPPIAKAAHVSGAVVLVATFDLAGKVMEARTVSGPMMLHSSAETFVKSWQANPYTGPRSCPVVVEFVFDGTTYCDDKPKDQHNPPLQTERKDAQHFQVVANRYGTCDPAGVITRRRRFGIF